MLVTEPWSSAAWLTTAFPVCSSPVPQQSKRLTTPAIALRSKSMTSELEEMGKKRINCLLGAGWMAKNEGAGLQGEVDREGECFRAEEEKTS